METPDTQKVAIVTGGSRGIGRAIVRQLCGMGAHVVFNYSSDTKRANELVSEIEEKGGSATALQADIARVAEIENMFDLALSTHGRLDILVNNAGIATYKNIADFSEEEYDRIFTINVKGVFFCCRQAARAMADNGSIINIGSTVTRVMLPTYGAYAATKGAVEQITRVLAKELGDRGIRVNTLSPGPVDTTLFQAGKSAEQINQMASMAALNRFGTVDDIAGMVALLVDERSAWVSGQNILVNGGFAA
ncbi:MAG: SDR family oxidoreductase [Desulfopila sp.]